MNKEKEHKKSDISFNEKTDYFSFLDRHIGSTQSEIDEILKFLDSDSLDDLISSTVPNQILLDVPLGIDNPLSEKEAIDLFVESRDFDSQYPHLIREIPGSIIQAKEKQ